MEWRSFLKNICILQVVEGLTCAFITLVGLFGYTLIKLLHEGLFLLKVILIFGAFIATLWLDFEFIDGLLTAFRIVGGLFIIYQSIYLIDMGYTWSYYWKELYDHGYKFYGFLLILFTLIMYGLVILFLVLDIFSADEWYSWLLFSFNIALPILSLISVIFKFHP